MGRSPLAFGAVTASVVGVIMLLPCCGSSRRVIRGTWTLVLQLEYLKMNSTWPADVKRLEQHVLPDIGREACNALSLAALRSSSRHW